MCVFVPMCVNKDVPNVCHLPMCACVCFDLNHITHTNPARSSVCVCVCAEANERSENERSENERKMNKGILME